MRVYASVAAGIRCDVRNNDVLPPYMSSIKFTTPKTTLFRYNIEPKTIIHIPFHSSLCFPKFSLPFSLFLAIHTSCNIYIVMLLILVHCPLPGSSRFFLSFIKKTPQEFLVVSLFRLLQITFFSMILRELFKLLLFLYK